MEENYIFRLLEGLRISLPLRNWHSPENRPNKRQKDQPSFSIWMASLNLSFPGWCGDNKCFHHNVVVASMMMLLHKGRPLPGPKLGSCLPLGNELSEETHVLTKQEILLGKGTWVDSRRVREPRRTALPHGSQSRGLWWWDYFRVVFSLSFWLRVLPGDACLVQPRWMPERILGGGRTCGVSFWPFLNSSVWWRLISSMFLTRTSCHKITYANGYYGAWPGWKVSVHVLPLATPPWETSYSRYYLGWGRGLFLL